MSEPSVMSSVPSPASDSPRRLATVANGLTLLRIVLVPVFVVFLAFQRLLIEGIATTGMKR